MDIIDAVLIIGTSVGLLCVITIMIFQIIEYRRCTNNHTNAIEAANIQAASAAKQEIVNRTNDFNDYIIKVCGNVATLKWQEYVDGHDIQKLTREQLKNLASECASMIINMINLDHIDYDNLLCTQEYTTFLIINTTFNYLKRLSDKTINDLSE